MSTTKFFIGVILAFILAAPAGAVDIDMPKVKVVKIKEPVTRLILDILPGRGVKCVFPWILDARTSVLPARIVITNDAVFEQLRGENQNAIEFRVKAKGEQYEREVGDAFISVEGFHFVFTLRVNFAKKAHYSTILFDLEEARKYELINDAIKKYRMAAQDKLNDAEMNIDELANQQSLKVIARTVLSKPKKSNVYEKQTRRLDDGSRIVFSADKILSYNDIHIIKIGVENDSGLDPIYVNAIQIEKTSGNTQPMVAQYEIQPRIDAGQKAKGYVVTQDPRIIDSEDTRMKLLTNKGEVVLEW